VERNHGTLNTGWWKKLLLKKIATTQRESISGADIATITTSASIEAASMWTIICRYRSSNP